MTRLTVAEFNEILGNEILVYDGAMGTNLQVQGLSDKDFGGKIGCSEALNLYCPDAVKKVHLDFLAVGCRVIETNTFGGTRITLREYDLEDRVVEINKLAVEFAKEAIKENASDKRCFIAGSIGPTSMLPSLGNIDFKDMVEAYLEQFNALWDAGIDIFQIETCQDLLQVKAALYALDSLFESKETRCPVVVSVTLEAAGTMLVGSDVDAVITTIEPYDFVDVLSVNCATGPAEMVRHISAMAKKWPRALGVMPNAGLPESIDGKAVYKMTAKEFSDFQLKFASEFGVNIVGGCCGTNPSHLEAVVRKVSKITPINRNIQTNGTVSSLFSSTSLKQEPAPALIAERTNANGAKQFRELLLKNDWDAMTNMGREQARGGAHLLDLCVAYVGRNEVEDLRVLTPMFATNVKLPLVIDSTNYEAVEAALMLHGGRCVINSVNLEDGGSKLRQTAKLAKKFGAALICLTIDEEGMAKTSKEKIRIAERMHTILTEEFSFRDSDLLFDTLTFTVGSGDSELRNSAIETLHAIELINEKYPEANTILGVSNISFGLKAAAREVLNSVFLSMAVKKGLSSAIVNPAKIIPIYKISKKERKLAENLLLNTTNDGSSLSEYMHAFDGKAQSTRIDIATLPPVERMSEKVIEGDASNLDSLVTELLKDMTPEAIINTILLSAMKKVGDLFGSGQLQLPFVLQSAEVVKRTVGILEPLMDKKEASADRKLVLATVSGDVHDIGKNLVNIMLSNNGFSVFDLGIKVDIDTMIKAVEKHGANVIGMSGLLVKSTQVMKENLEELNRRNLSPTVILGGAALTKEFVKSELQPIYKGKVFYSKDAIDGLKIMESLLSKEKKERLVASPVKVARIEEIVQKPQNWERDIKMGAANRHQFVTIEDKLKVPFYGSHLLEISSSDLFHLVSKKVLFEARWGYKSGNLSDEEYSKIIEEKAQPEFEKYIKNEKNDNIFQCRGVYGYYRCKGIGNSLKIFDESGLTMGEFDFPRQRVAPNLSIPDFFSEGDDDVIGLWAVTLGSKVCEVEKELFALDKYKEYHQLHGLGAEMADCGAVHIHRHVHQELLPCKMIENNKPLGVRYSFGYPACPDLVNQKELLRILDAKRIGISLTDSSQMVPELSVSGFIVFNKHARYFVP